ncbi:MAG: ribosome silencing factor [bacterium]|nr:ribosome silencing factor [bacterium]
MIIKTNLKKLSIFEIAERCARVLEEKKAVNTAFVDLSETNSYLGSFLITTANSLLHCRALAKELRSFLSAGGLKEMNKPDMNSGWIILDYEAIIIHIFTEELRDYYQLEKLWGDTNQWTANSGRLVVVKENGRQESVSVV